jgi:hypothetical protein
MKKNVKNAVETELKNLIYESDNMSLYRINNALHLFGGHSLNINDVFEIMIWGIKNNMDDDFWNTKITSADKDEARSINLIYWLTGGDGMWRIDNNIWKNDWTKMYTVFLDRFDTKIMKIAQSAKTLGDLKNKVKNKLSCEDFYEYGLSMDLIIKDETLL